MADPADKGAPDGDTPDSIKQVKSEFSRKTDNLTQQLADTQRKIDAIMAAVLNPPKKQAAPASDDVEADVDPIDNPKLYAKRIKDQAKREVMEEVNSMSQQQADIRMQQEAVLNKLVQDYPELNDRTSELFIKAQEMQASMSANERFSPIAIRAIIRDAAADLGVLPVSKRSKVKEGSEVDEFSVGTKTGSGSKGGEQKGAKTKIAPSALAFAELLGRPVTDEKYLDRLSKASERKSWSKWK